MTKLEEKVVLAARAVGRRFARRRAPADLDDVIQDAAVGALVAVRSGVLDDRRNVMGYLYRAGRSEAGLAASRALAVVSISEKQAKNARKYQGRHVRVKTDEGEEIEVVDLLPGNLPSPIQVLEERREIPARTARRIRRNRLLEAWLAGLEDRLEAGDARALRMLLGLGDEEIAAGGVDEAAFRTGVPRARVLRAIRLLKDRVGQDRELRREQRLMEEAEAT